MSTQNEKFEKLTDVTYEMIFTEIVRQFGPHAEWEDENNPFISDNKKHLLDEFCNDMAKLVKCSASTIRIFINMAYRTTEKMPNNSRIDMWITCKFLAKRAGFINFVKNPTFMLMEYK